MKTKNLVLVSIMLLSICSMPVSGQSKSFSGEWKLNMEKSTDQDNQLLLYKIIINQKNDSLFTYRVYENEYGEQYPFKENLALNGKESKITIYDMPRTAKASLSSDNGSLNFESTTMFNGNSGPDSLKSKETWIILNKGKTLKMDVAANYNGGEFEGTLVFDKVE